MKQKQPDYIELLKKSLYNLANHPVIFIPFILGFFLFILLAGVVVLEGLFMITSFNVSIETLFPSMISSSIMFMIGALFIFIDLVLMFMFGAYITAMTYVGFYQVSVKNKVSLDSMIKGARPLFLNVLKFSLIKFAIFFIPITIVAGIIVGLVFVNLILAIVLGIMLFMILMAYMIYMGFAIFFMGPMIASSRKPIMTLLRGSFQYLHNNVTHVLFTWVILLCIGIVLAMVVVPLQLSASIIPFILIPVFGFRVIMQIVVGVYTNLFLFNSYFNVNKVKK